MITADFRSDDALGIPVGALGLRFWSMDFAASPDLDALAKVLHAQALKPNTPAWHVARDLAAKALEAVPIMRRHMAWTAARVLRNAARNQQSRPRLVTSLQERVALLVHGETTVTVRDRGPGSRHVPYVAVRLPSGAEVLVGAGPNAPAVEIATSWRPISHPGALLRGRLVEDSRGAQEEYATGVATTASWHLVDLETGADLWDAVVGQVAEAVVAVGLTWRGHRHLDVP